MSNPNAKLFSMLTVKNKKMFGSHRKTGTAGCFKNQGGREVEKCSGQAKRAVITNWVKVIKSPFYNFSPHLEQNKVKQVKYHSWAPH